MTDADLKAASDHLTVLEAQTEAAGELADEVGHNVTRRLRRLREMGRVVAGLATTG